MMLKRATQGVEMDSTGLCLALTAAVGNLKPKNK